MARHFFCGTGVPIVRDPAENASSAKPRRAGHRIRLLCVDHHQLVLDCTLLLMSRQPDMRVVASATTGEQAVDLFRQHRPDVTLIDLQLPSMSGVEAIRAIRHEDPEARIVALAGDHRDEEIHQALQAGAAVCILKSDHSDDLVYALRKVHGGERPRSVSGPRPVQPALTPREIDVVRLIANGLRNKEIAVALRISEETAKVHVKNILAKLGVNDRAAVIAVALRRRLIHLD